ncbi:MAG: hypothetical protein LHV68_00700 [Elusimicrobia bacterium]|nr:hypothetical protein [Candidatus Liberimonas magnetica]
MVSVNNGFPIKAFGNDKEAKNEDQGNRDFEVKFVFCNLHFAFCNKKGF